MALFRRSSAAGTAEAVEPPSLSEVDAMVGIAVAAMYADGVIGAEEHEILMTHVSRFAMCKGMDQRDLRAMFGRIEALADELGDEGFLGLCAEALPARLRNTAYFLAVDILNGDNEVGSDEHAFLGRVQRVLQIDDADARKIREVVALKFAC